MAEEKLRINSLAKDLNVKSKDLIELLAEHGYSGKSYMTALESDELSIIFEHYTQLHQTDIAAFFKSYDDKIAEKKKHEEEEKEKAKAAIKQQREAMKPKKPVSSNIPKKQLGPQQPKRAKTDVRVVDTRGTQSVNIAKYDEKLDTFVADPDRLPDSKVKIKKKNTRDQQDGGRNSRKKFNDRIKPKFIPKPVQLKITVPDEISVGELALRMKITAGDVIKKLISMSVMASVTDMIDYDTAYLVADEFKIIVEKEVVVSLEDKLFGNDEPDKEENLKLRAPVVVVMGHVDHGKTSLLDAIRNTNVTEGEAGGITQHIGAYNVKIGDRDITFLDTPGHAAFTAMRARGANLTDIAVLVVAADDGIMPQTVEAINHAKAAKVGIIVAINKMDKPGADPERVKNELTKYDLLPEEWGGDTICVPVSAVKRTNIDKLLEMIILSADMMELKANPEKPARGVVVEAKLDKGRGAVATVLVQDGTLKTGDIIIAGTTTGRVRMMTDDKGKAVKTAGPSRPVEIMGLSEVPGAGDPFSAVTDERLARELVDKRKHEEKTKQFSSDTKVTLDDLFGRIESGSKTLNIVVKADVQGSAEAVKSSLEKLSNDEVKVSVIHAGAGAINEGDVMLASASDALIIGFNIRPDKQAVDAAARDKVEIRTYRIIYECIDEIQAAMKGMLAPKYKETVLGRAEVRQIIRVPSVGTIAGSYITDGKITRSALIRVLRDGVVIFEDKIASLKRFKDDVREVAQSYECGIGLDRFNDIKDGDVLEAYIMEEVAR
ncbi:MAG: translation initiation factor IF-2 [Eubacteriales bacterium]|nr:translation initiation factor IF-2 [Eubacteriales bacterium]